MCFIRETMYIMRLLMERLQHVFYQGNNVYYEANDWKNFLYQFILSCVQVNEVLYLTQLYPLCLWYMFYQDEYFMIQHLNPLICLIAIAYKQWDLQSIHVKGPIWYIYIYIYIPAKETLCNMDLSLCPARLKYHRGSDSRPLTHC